MIDKCSDQLNRRRGLALLCCFLLFVLSSTTTAGAATPSSSGIPAADSSLGGLLELEEDQFTLQASHGYEVTVTGFPGGDRHSVTLSAQRGHSEVEYTVPGTVTEEEMRATFGSLGSVEVHFEPSGQVREAIDYCDSTHPTVAVRLGSFVGTIDFRGERDYTSVEASRADGGVGNSLALPGDRENSECIGFTSAGAVTHKAKFAALEASSPKSGVHFTAIATTEIEGEGASSAATSHVFLSAGNFTKEKKMTINRGVRAWVPAMDFGFNSALSKATIDPSAPFRGIARFRKGPHGTSSWTGSLKAPVPGLGMIRLAGPGFHVKFVQIRGTVTSIRPPDGRRELGSLGRWYGSEPVKRECAAAVRGVDPRRSGVRGVRPARFLGNCQDALERSGLVTYAYLQRWNWHGGSAEIRATGMAPARRSGNDKGTRRREPGH